MVLRRGASSSCSLPVSSCRTSGNRASVWHYPIAYLFEDVAHNDKIPFRVWDTHGQQSCGPIAPPVLRNRIRVEPDSENPALASNVTQLVSPGGTAHAFPCSSSVVEDTRGGGHAMAQLIHSADDQDQHQRNECKPCIFWYHGVCRWGANCEYCHMDHEPRKYKALNVSRTTRHRLRARRQEKALAQNPNAASPVPRFFRL